MRRKKTMISVLCRCFVPSVANRNRESWRLLVKEHMAKIGKLRSPFLGWFKPFVLGLKKIVVLGSVLVNQPITVHSGGVSRGRVCGC